MMGSMHEGNAQQPIEFGPSHLEAVPLRALNELPQVRTSYDPESLQDLARSIMSQKSVDKTKDFTTTDFDLTSPLSVGRHSPSSAKLFLADHADFYEIASSDRTQFGDLRTLDDGRIAILTAGHRRKRAVHLLVDQLGLDAARVTVRADVRNDIPFAMALGLQLRENNHERPPAYDEARAIALYFKHIHTQTGLAPNVGRMSAELGFSETKVREALSFASLPARVQAFAADGVLPFSTLRRLRPLQEAYERFFSQDGHDAGNTKSVEDELIIFCNKLLNSRLSGKMEQHLGEMIQNKVLEIKGQADYQQGLFLLEPEHSSQRRADSSRGIAKLAFSILNHHIRYNELSSESLEELTKSLEQARRVAASRSTVLDTFDQPAS